ncbi:MAG TPA: type II toxin-antitoxin system HicB family antitoxin [Polyangia bacterium]|jgi:predicted RNase H-like HicB family nuclease|nr:type II toxin-antitoxin system HicB family antitoxin [Polyangia bacterium]
MELTIETEREAPGRWIAEVTQLSGVMVYGKTKAEAVRKAKDLARKVLADRLKHGEPIPGDLTFRSRAAQATV